MTVRQPRIVVLCASTDEPPDHLDALTDRAEIVLTDAALLGRELPDADALFLWDFFSPAVRDVWESRRRLRWIHVAAAGVDSLLFDDLRSSDVAVTNARGVFDRPIAEHVLAEILAHAKQVRLSHDLQREHRWEHRETARIAGATALVIGTGAIGRATARLLSAAGLEVRGAGRRRVVGDPDFSEVLATRELVDHVPWAQYVVLVAPLTEQTRGMIDSRVLAAMRPGTHLINVGRGPLVVTADLLDAAGRITAALDVTDPEPPPRDHPLWATPGITLTPHMSGDVVGWQDVLARQFVANAERWLAGEPLANLVDKQLGYVPGA